MRRIMVVSSTFAALLVAGCNQDKTSGPETFVVPVYARNMASSNFGTGMSGAEEVPAKINDEVGEAIFKLSADGSTMHYKVITSPMTGVTQSHIHIGAAGTNGPIVVFLFGFVTGGVTTNGILAEGDFTQSNLIPRPAINFGGTMAELLGSLRSGGAYVNVHTVVNPGGEIRGQIEERGPTK